MDQGLSLAELDQLREHLIAAQLTISCAESVTVGRVQSLLARPSDASKYFVGGLTAYNLQQKVTHLQVDASDAAAHDCVSLQVAEQMALGACRLFGSDLGLGVTGYAEPYPQQNVDEPFALVALARHGQIVRSGQVAGMPLDQLPDAGADQRPANQEFFAMVAVRTLLEFLRATV